MYKTILFALTALLAFSSCNDVDGDWPPMKWKTEAKMDKANKIAVPAEFRADNRTHARFGGVLRRPGPDFRRHRRPAQLLAEEEEKGERKIARMFSA